LVFLSLKRRNVLYHWHQMILNGAGKKVAEFGGNPFGQGNKRQLGSGWPTVPLVVDGNCVTINFEMKSR
jgi:hypothetical protein